MDMVTRLKKKPRFSQEVVFKRGYELTLDVQVIDSIRAHDIIKKTSQVQPDRQLDFQYEKTLEKQQNYHQKNHVQK